MEVKYSKLAEESGVVGAGGAGFPTHVKLNASVDYLIVNGAECEPLMTVDQYLMEQFSRQICDTIDALRQELGAKEAVIGIKKKHPEAIAIMENALKPLPLVRIEPLGDFYPAGDEVVLVYETVGRQIPQGGIPLDCGVVVINIETVYNLYLASIGFPVTNKWVTVAGNVRKPGVYHVPIGTSIGEMVRLAGGATIADFRVINGGPMMGKLVGDLAEPVTKTTKGLLVLPEDSPVVVNRTMPLDRIIRQAQSVCCQCHFCTDLCPRHLLGYAIQPNKTILSAGYSMMVDTQEISRNALLCSECGACDLFGCPMGLSPRRVNQFLKGELAKKRVPPPDKGKAVTADFWRQFRRIPSARIVSRLGLTRYSSPVVLYKDDPNPDSVRLLLRQGVGGPAEPVVGVGDRVAAGDLVAKIPEGKLASNIFASIDGIVSEVTSAEIVIKKSKGEDE